MPKQLNKKKPPKDINQLAAYIVEQTTKDKDDKIYSQDNHKNPRP